jgi:putative ABC transport system permease protein
MRDWTGQVDWWHDLRYAARVLLKNPGFTIIALLTLAVGIGANTTVCSIVNGVLLRPLPFDQANRIAAIQFQDERGAQTLVQPINLPPLQQLSHDFDYFAVYLSRGFASNADEPSTSAATVSADYFKVFNIRPALGRDFFPDDEKPDTPAVAIISHEYWQNRFGGDPNVLGQTLMFPQAPPLTVIGVLPQGVVSPNLYKPDSIWVLPTVRAEENTRYGFRMFGRLKDAITTKQAGTELASIGDGLFPAKAIVRTSGTSGKLHPVVLSLNEFIVGSSRTTIVIFAGAVLSVLLIAIVNLVGLELARLPQWESEFAIRIALGASRWRLLRLMLLKALVLGITGGLLGITIAAGLHHYLMQQISGIPRKDSISLDTTVLVVSLALSVVSSLLICIVPALGASGGNVRTMTHSTAKSYTASRGTRLFQDALTASETALALVLVIAAGLFINNLWRLVSHDLGFATHGVTAIRVTLPSAYNTEQQIGFFSTVLNRVKRMTNVESASLAFVTPIDAGLYTSVTLPDEPQKRPVSINAQGASGDYFSLFRIRVLAGRTFTEEEALQGKPVALVSATLATKLWAGRNPVGQRFKGIGAEPYTVIGIVGDAEYGYFANAGLFSAGYKGTGASSIGTERVTAYFPVSTMIRNGFGFFRRSSMILARTTGGSKDIVAAITEMEPKATVTPAVMDDFIAARTKDQRFQTMILGGFGSIGLLLAAMGIYAVITHSVVRRTKEIGVRMALGAHASELFMQVCRQALGPCLLGMIVGLAIAAGVQHILQGYLYTIQPDDAPTYTIVASTMFVVILVASAIPARRATKLDPMIALRHE